MEYCALGVPVITTPLPLASDLIHSENVGFEVPWDDPSAVVDAILRLRAEPALRRQMGVNGHGALREHDWNRLSTDFVRIMDGVAKRLRDQTQNRFSSAKATDTQAVIPRESGWPSTPGDRGEFGVELAEVTLGLGEVLRTS